MSMSYATKSNSINKRCQLAAKARGQSPGPGSVTDGMQQGQHYVPRCHGLRVYPVCVCNTVRLGQVRSRHNLKPSGTRFECVSGLSV